MTSHIYFVELSEPRNVDAFENEKSYNHLHCFARFHTDWLRNRAEPNLLLGDQDGVHSMLYNSSIVVRLASIHSAVRATLLESMGQERRTGQCCWEARRHQIPHWLQRWYMHFQSQKHNRRQRHCTRHANDQQYSGAEQKRWLTFRTFCFRKQLSVNKIPNKIVAIAFF